MNKHPFYFEDDDSLILVKARLGIDMLTLALDTGASHTVLDLPTLIVAGMEPEAAKDTIELETGNGVVQGLLFEISNFHTLGISKEKMQICAYDFMANNVFFNIHGVLGLDFFKGLDLLISFKRFHIELS